MAFPDQTGHFRLWPHLKGLTMRLNLDIGSRYPEITGQASDAFAADLKDACARENFTELVLDLKGCKMVSSMALGTIFAVSQKLREQNKTLHIANVSEKIANLLRMVNMEELMQSEE